MSCNHIMEHLNYTYGHQVVCLLEINPEFVQLVKQVIIIKATDIVLCRKWAFIKANKRLDYILF